MSRRRYRRNPSTGVKLSLGALGVGAAAFVAWVFLRKPVPTYGPDGIVRVAGWIPLNYITPGKPGYAYYAVGAKVPASYM